MILTGENWSTGRKTYSMGGRWMDEYGAMVEWYWQGKTEVPGEKHYTVWVVDEWVWSNGGMILTGENWSAGRKTLYSVGGRWMNEYGAMVRWYWQGKTEVPGEKHYTAWVVDEWMSSGIPCPCFVAVPLGFEPGPKQGCARQLACGSDRTPVCRSVTRWTGRSAGYKWRRPSAWPWYWQVSEVWQVAQKGKQIELNWGGIADTRKWVVLT